MPPKLRLGKAEPAFEKSKVLQHGISQRTLNELAEDWDAMYTALLPFARYAEILPPVVEGELRVTDAGVALYGSRVFEDRTVTFADIRQALKVLQSAHERLEKRRVSQAERQMAGHGDVCRLCGSVIEGSEPHELEGYCSKTCQREDGNSEWPSPEEGSLTSLQPDPMFEVKDKP
jgi:hypothetical protein